MRSLVRQHRLAGDIADGQNARVGCALPIVAHHKTATVDLDVGVFQADPLAVRSASHGDQNTIKSLESGSGKLSTVIAVLRELGALDALDSFIPEPSISPLQLAKMQGRQRERATGTRRKRQSKGDSEW